MFVVGFFLAFNQAFLSKRFIRRFGELMTLRIGLFICAIGFIAITISKTLWIYVIFYYVLNLGISLSRPSTRLLPPIPRPLAKSWGSTTPSSRWQCASSGPCRNQLRHHRRKFYHLSSSAQCSSPSAYAHLNLPHKRRLKASLQHGIDLPFYGLIKTSKES